MKIAKVQNWPLLGLTGNGRKIKCCGDNRGRREGYVALMPLVGLAGLLLFVPAAGVEAFPELNPSKAIEERNEKARLAEEQFENSDLVKELRRRTEENRASNKKKIQDKYCLRQAELGIGDCGELREVPGGIEALKKSIRGDLDK